MPRVRVRVPSREGKRDGSGGAGRRDKEVTRLYTLLREVRKVRADNEPMPPEPDEPGQPSAHRRPKREVCTHDQQGAREGQGRAEGSGQPPRGATTEDHGRSRDVQSRGRRTTARDGHDVRIPERLQRRGAGPSEGLLQRRGPHAERRTRTQREQPRAGTVGRPGGPTARARSQNVGRSPHKPRLTEGHGHGHSGEIDSGAQAGRRSDVHEGRREGNGGGLDRSGQADNIPGLCTSHTQTQTRQSSSRTCGGAWSPPWPGR